MKEQLANLIQSYLKNPNEQEIQALLDIFQVKYFQKGDLFKTPYQVSKKVGFLVEGSVKMSILKENGEKITGGVLSENQFVADIMGIRTGEVSSLGIEFLQPSTILIAPVFKVRSLLEVNLTFNRFLVAYITGNMVRVIKLYALFIAGSSKDRYEFVLQDNPEQLKNIPLHFIANMIGVTPTQLSRIRKSKKEA